MDEEDVARPAPGEVIARLADEIEDAFPILRSEPYSDRAIGVYSVLRFLRQRGFASPVAPLPFVEHPSFADYAEGQPVSFVDAEVADWAYGVVRRVSGFAVLVQARLFGDAGWGKDASGEMYVVSKRERIAPLSEEDQESW